MWRETKNGLNKSFTFLDFKEAFAFMQKVAKIAEKQQHHPLWINQYNRVEIWLNSHEAEGKITDKDKQLAKEIDKIEDSKI